MLIRRLYDDELAQACYLIGCEQSGEAIVIDPNRDLAPVIEAARQAKLRIAFVSETHIHADYASGSRALADTVGAPLLLSDEGGAGWQYTFAKDAHARLLKNGDVITVGAVTLTVMHTPGHTPEHISFLVTDTATSPIPIGVVTGDFVFVGDVGRPDLLERAANVADTMDASARRLFASLQAFKQLPDHLQLWPGHGAGSACGKSLGAMPQSTLGYERLVNWAFREEDEDAFVRAVLAGQPEPPAYFAEMKRINRDGVAPLPSLPSPPHLDPGALVPLLEGGAFVIDARPSAEYAAKHVVGTLNVPLSKSFSTWAGCFVDYTKDAYLIVSNAPGAAERAARSLAMIGFDRVAGVFGPDAVEASEALGFATGSVSVMDVRDVEVRMSAGQVLALDVRKESEFAEGHARGAMNVPLATLRARIAEVPDDHPIAVSCAGGDRSAIAASLLEMHGRRRVTNVRGGMRAWVQAGLPVER